MTEKTDHVSYIFTGPHTWATYAIFNANAFPESLENNVKVCSTRLALCFLYLDELKINIIKARHDFLMSLKKYRADVEQGPQNKKDDLRVIAYSDGLRYVAGLFGFLNSVKSFLDVYANLMGNLISPELNWSFKRGKIKGENIAGGKILRWLECCSNKNFSYAESLSEVTLFHSITWMTSLVSYRDNLSHYNDLAGFVHMHVPLYKESPWYRENEISGPTMPHGDAVEEYCTMIVMRLAEYIRETVLILPSVDTNLISVDQFLNE